MSSRNGNDAGLTLNGIRLLMQTQQHPNTHFMPILQVLNLKRVSANSNASNTSSVNDRYRVVLSDGDVYANGMMATQINQLASEGIIQDNSIVEVSDFIVNQVQGRPVVIVLGMRKVKDWNVRIGTPMDYFVVSSSDGNSNAAAINNYSSTTTAAPPVYQQQQQQQNNYQANSNTNRYNSYSNNSSSSSKPISTYSNSSNQMFTQISQLNMYMSRWTIRARVTSKSPIKTWSNSRGEGRLFSVELLDASGTDIKGTFFKEAVDRFYEMLQVDKVYTLSGGKLKIANMQWNTCKSQFEITFDQNSEIHQVNDDGGIQQNVFEFVKIQSLEGLDLSPPAFATIGGPGSPPGSTPIVMVDIVGVVKSVTPVNTIISKRTQQELFKCDLVIVDDSATEVNLTIWGEEAKNAEGKYAQQPVVAFKKLRVSDYGGRSLGTTSGSSIIVNPKIPEADSVRNWWTSQGSRGTVNVKSISSGGGGLGGKRDSFESRKPLNAIKDENMGHAPDGKADWFSTKVTFTFLRKEKEGGPWYTACANPDEPCKNRPKVTQSHDGAWICEKCGQQRETCVRRYIFSACITDNTSTVWASLFNEQAEVLLGEGMSADSLYQRCFENGDMEYFEQVFNKANYTDWIVKCKVRCEPMGDEMRVKTTIFSLSPVDYLQESRDLLDTIRKQL